MYTVLYSGLQADLMVRKSGVEMRGEDCNKRSRLKQEKGEDKRSRRVNRVACIKTNGSDSW